MPKPNLRDRTSAAQALSLLSVFALAMLATACDTGRSASSLERASLQAMSVETSATASADSTGLVPLAERQTIWKPLAIGAGGFITGIDLHRNGTLRLIRTDTYGAYVWQDDAWRQLVTETSMPAEDRSVLGSGVSEIVAAPSDPQRLYMLFLGRLYRSNDQGARWQRTAFAQSAQGPNDNWRTGGTRIAVDPLSADVLYVGTQQEGLRSSRDGGASWSVIDAVPRGQDTETSGNTRGLGVTVWIDPSGGALNGRTRVIYAGSWQNGIWRSQDAGASWTQIAGTGTSPRNGWRHSVAADGTLYIADQSAVWRWRGGVWTNVSPRSDYWQSAAVDPTNANRVYAFNGAGDAWRSLDGGANWVGLSKSRSAVGDIPWFEFTEEDYMSAADIRFDPRVPGQLWFAQGIGVWKASVNDSASSIVWRSESRGIEQLVMNDIVAPPGGKPVSAAWDRAIFVHENADAFPQRHGPTARFNSAWQLDWSASNPRFLVANTSDHRFCCQQDGKAVQAGWSADGGRTWTAFASLPAPPGSDPNNAWRFAFGNIAVAANDADNIVWLPTFNGAMAYTRNRGASWQIVSLPGEDPAAPGSHFGLFLNRKVLAADRVLPNTFYFVHSGGGSVTGVWRSTDGGSNWTRRFAGELTSYSVFNATLKTVPARAGHLFFTPGPLDGLDNPLRRSTDGGATWQDVANVTGVHAFGFGKALETNGYPTVFIAGKVSGEYGIWRSVDDARTWARIGRYPIGSLDLIRTIDGDKDVFGRLYVGFGGSGAAYGQLKPIPVRSTPLPANRVVPRAASISGPKARPEVRAGFQGGQSAEDSR